jgi:hypothetical protein
MGKNNPRFPRHYVNSATRYSQWLSDVDGTDHNARSTYPSERGIVESPWDYNLVELTTSSLPIGNKSLPNFL